MKIYSKNSPEYISNGKYVIGSTNYFSMRAFERENFLKKENYRPTDEQLIGFDFINVKHDDEPNIIVKAYMEEILGGFYNTDRGVMNT